MKKDIKRHIKNAILMYKYRISKNKNELEKDENKNKEHIKIRCKSIITATEQQIKKYKHALEEMEKNNLEPALNVLAEIIRIKKFKSWVSEDLKKTYLDLGKRLEKDEIFLKMKL